MFWTDPIYQGYNRRVAELKASSNPFAHGIAWMGGPDFVPIDEAKVPLQDPGFVKSDLTYDVPAVWDGRFFRLDDHLDRFEKSIAKLRLTNRLGRPGLRDKLVEMVAISGIRDAYVMMIVTRGLRYTRQTLPEDCVNHCHLMVTPYLWIMDEATLQKGGSAVIARNVRRIPSGAINATVKNLRWGDLTRGIQEARDRGAQYSILTDGDGNLTEGSGFNIVLVKDGKLYTPKCDVLEGVTRKSVLAVADKLGIPWVIDDLPVGQIYNVDELVLVTTAGGVMPITRLDGEPVGDGRVGPLTRALWKGYWDDHYDPAVSFPISYH